MTAKRSEEAPHKGHAGPGRKPEFRQAGRIYTIGAGHLAKALCVRADTAFVLLTEDDLLVIRHEGAKESPLLLAGTRKIRLKAAAAQADKVAAAAWGELPPIDIILARCILLAAAEFAPSASPDSIAREAFAQAKALFHDLNWKRTPREIKPGDVQRVLQIVLGDPHA